MNTKILISFLALAVILATVYLTISTLYETSLEKSYNTSAFAPPVSYNHIKKSSRPSIGKAATSNQFESINVQALPSASLQSSTTKSGVEVGSREISYKNPSNQRTIGNLQPGFSASSGIGLTRKPLPRASGGSYSSNMSLGLSGRTMNKESASTSSGSLAFNNNKFSATPSYEPFSGGAGTPDPGGNIDDSGDDDIVFIPVPDGLPYLILLSLLYAMFKLIKVRKSLLSSAIKACFAKSSFTFY